MACCLMAPSHYMNQCWLVISEVLTRFYLILSYPYQPSFAAENYSQHANADNKTQNETNKNSECHASWKRKTTKSYGTTTSRVNDCINPLALGRYDSNLTQWGRDKMADIFQTTISNAFSWMKMYEFWLRFHWTLFPRVRLTISQHWFR